MELIDSIFDLVQTVFNGIYNIFKIVYGYYRDFIMTSFPAQGDTIILITNILLVIIIIRAIYVMFFRR